MRTHKRGWNTPLQTGGCSGNAISSFTGFDPNVVAMTDQTDNSQQGGSSEGGPPPNQGWRLLDAIAREKASKEAAAGSGWKPTMQHTRPPFPDYAGLVLAPGGQGEASASDQASHKPGSVTPPNRKRDAGLLHEGLAAPSGSLSPSRSAAGASAEGDERLPKSPRSSSPSALRTPLGRDGHESVLSATGPGMEYEVAERVDERSVEEVFDGRVAGRIDIEQDGLLSDPLPPVRSGDSPDLQENAGLTQAGAEGDGDAPEAGLVHNAPAPEAGGQAAQSAASPGEVVAEASGSPAEAFEEGSTQQSVDLSVSQASGGTHPAIDWACNCKLKAGLRSEARATVYVPVLDAVRFERQGPLFPEAAEGIELGVDQLGGWWCDRHARLAVEFLNKGPIASRQAAAWELAVAQAKDELAAREQARGDKQMVADLEAQVQEDRTAKDCLEMLRDSATARNLQLRQEYEELEGQQPRLLYKSERLAATLGELRSAQSSLDVSEARCVTLEQQVIASRFTPPAAVPSAGIDRGELDRLEEANARQVEGLHE